MFFFYSCDIQHYATASACIDKYAVDLFKAGAKWLMSQPISERLTEAEKAEIIKTYQEQKKIKRGLIKVFYNLKTIIQRNI